VLDYFGQSKLPPPRAAPSELNSTSARMRKSFRTGSPPSGVFEATICLRFDARQPGTLTDRQSADKNSAEA